MKRLVLLIALVITLHWAPAHAQSGVYFDDSNPNRLRLGNGLYELILSKTNGAILALTDKATKASLTLGSRHGCLWGAVFPNTTRDYVGGCSYSASGPNRFTYAWNPARATLTLTYTWDSGASRRVDATATVTVTPEPYFDLRLTLLNQWGAVMHNAILPSDLLFADSEVQAGYGPFLLPGVRFKPSFFTSSRSYVPTYPSDAAFADYLALDVAGSHFAFYTVNPDDPIQPVALGFIDNDPDQAGTFYTYHSFHTLITDGSTYVSPVVRIRVGQPT